MVSPELLRRYPFFAGFSPDQLTTIAMAAEELAVEAGHRFFNEGDDLTTLYLVIEGSVAISLSMPEKGSRSVLPPPAGQAREIVVSVVRASDVFAWSALVPPGKATSNARAEEACRVVAIDCSALHAQIERDPAFGYQLLLRIAQIARDRIQDLHVEALASAAGASVEP
ncbi:MAG: cyclic nucleotide-binding domain-containing protein [Chloroflexi bacterium]|nr:cyclic nucleotide-binding domain-containing protein [Chloroflexota bacterium]